MMDRVAALIVNYNMPERTDAMVEHICIHVACPVDVFVIDNGSDIKEPSKYTAMRLDENVQTTNGWLMGLHYLDALRVAKGKEYGAYWFLITSAEFVEDADPLTPMMQFLERDKNAVGVHPALTEDSTTSWDQLITNGMKGGTRRTWMIDNIASLYRADWFDSIGRFDPSLVYAWGIDLETCWKAREQGRTLHICEPAMMKKVTNIGYKMERMNMSTSQREKLAGDNMRHILQARYGPQWWQRMTREHVT